MLIPQEFIESFELQYPAADIKINLPESIDKFPIFKEQVIASILKHNKLCHNVLYKGMNYDIINMTYSNPTSPLANSPLSQKGYATVVHELYLTLGTNRSEKTFEYVLDDIKEINVARFNADIVSQIGNYYTIKGVELINAWLQYCITQSKFKMNYADYNSAMGFDNLENDISNFNNRVGISNPKSKKLPKSTAPTDVYEDRHDNDSLN